MSDLRATLLGAAGEVTGSSTLIDTGHRRVLVDLGLVQGDNDADGRNTKLPDIDTRWLDAVALTHVHVDHSGRLPMLMQTPWRGPVFCTHPTADLAALALKASARLQRVRHHEWLKHRDRGQFTKGDSPPAILYTKAEVNDFLDRIVPLQFDEPVDLGEGVSLRLRQAGHILGAASVQIDCPDGRVVCSGDLGRDDAPPIPGPTRCPRADLVIMESTYGNRERRSVDNVESEMARIVAAAAHRGGPIIVPTFAIGRAQQLLHVLRSLQGRGLLEMNVYLDSPLAARATDIHAHWPDYLHPSSQHGLDDPLDFPGLYKLMSRKDASRLDDLAAPAVILAGNGFGEGGPILRHLARWLPDANATVLLSGHCLAGTLVGHLSGDPPTVKIEGRTIGVEASIEVVDAFGGHADATGLETWLLSNDTPGQVILNHGEPDAREALAARLTDKGCTIRTPSLGETCVA